MKKIFSAIALFCCLALTASAQQLRVHQGTVTYVYPASLLESMTYSNGGQTLTILGRSFSTAEIDSIKVTNELSTFTPNSINVDYAGNKAFVTVSGDIAALVTVGALSADVSIIADAALQEEVTYTLSGTSEGGSFFMDGEYKSTVVLNNLNLTSTTGAAIDIENGKRIAVVLPEGTASTLADAAGGAHKACFFINGHAEFSGAGTLNLSGRTKHAYASDEYTQFKSSFGTFNVTSALSDGMHVEQYLQTDGGTFNITGVQGDCIDVSATKDPLDEYNGQTFINAGTFVLNVAADDTKGIKSESDMAFSGGSITATVSGNGAKGISAGTNLLVSQAEGGSTTIKMTVTGTTYMPGDATLESKCRGIKVKGDMTFAGGFIDISATGAKSKAISIDGVYYYSSGQMTCTVDAEGGTVQIQ
ncbi:MAG: carbohydrate-binding domain-containing protein [Alloprevotella sp.]